MNPEPPDLELEDDVDAIANNTLHGRCSTRAVEAGFTELHRIAEFIGRKVVVRDGRVGMVHR